MLKVSNGEVPAVTHLLPVALSCGDPLAPFVIGDKGDTEDKRNDNDENPLHSPFRIARNASRMRIVRIVLNLQI